MKDQKAVRSLHLTIVMTAFNHPAVKAAMHLSRPPMMVIFSMNDIQVRYPARYAILYPTLAVMAAMFRLAMKLATLSSLLKVHIWDSILERTQFRPMPAHTNMYRSGMCRFQEQVLIITKLEWFPISVPEKHGYTPLRIIFNEILPKPNPVILVTETLRSF